MRTEVIISSFTAIDPVTTMPDQASTGSSVMALPYQPIQLLFRSGKLSPRVFVRKSTNTEFFRAEVFPRVYVSDTSCSAVLVNPDATYKTFGKTTGGNAVECP